MSSPKKAKMRRPPIGIRIMAGLDLVIDKMETNIKHGYFPASWTARDRRDVAKALKYLRVLLEWQRSKGRDLRAINIAPPNRFMGGANEG